MVIGHITASVTSFTFQLRYSVGGKYKTSDSI